MLQGKRRSGKARLGWGWRKEGLAEAISGQLTGETELPLMCLVNYGQQGQESV